MTRGSTLIETLVYISLFSILMIGIFSSVYMAIHLEDRRLVSQEEDSEILLQKYHE